MMRYRKQRSFRGLVVSIGLLVTACLVVPDGWAADTPAGTVIVNFAIGNYKDLDGNALPQVTSNTVTIRVAQVAGVDVTPASGAQAGGAGQTIAYPATITNNGNGGDGLTIALDTSGLPVGWTAFVYHDANGDGILQQSEMDAGPVTTTGTLAANAAFSEIVVVTVSADAPDGAAGSVSLTATSTFDTNVSDSGIFTTTVAAAVIVLSKSANPASGQPEDVVTYTIVGGNSGDEPAFNVVIRDTIPANTTYIANSVTVDGASQTDAAGDDITTALGGVISINWGDTAPGVTGTITFQVQVNGGVTAGTSVGNVAVVSYESPKGNAQPTASSNTSTFIVSSLAGVSVTPDSLRYDVTPGDTLQHAFIVTNTGSITDTFELVDSGALSSTQIWRDLDGNGTVDVGDVQITDTDEEGTPDTGALISGATKSYILWAVIPEGAAGLTEKLHTVTATSSVDGTVSDDTKICAVVHVSKPSLLSLTVTASEDTVMEGDVFMYTMVLGNTGSVSVTEVVLTQELPESVAFVSASEGGLEVDGMVTFLPDTLRVGETRMLEVTVHVSSDLKTETLLVTTATALGRETASVSDRAETVALPLGEDGILTATPWIVAGEVVSIVLVDPDLNTDPERTETITLETVHQRTGEIETLVYTETGSDTAAFTAYVSTTFGEQAGGDHDGTFHVRGGDILVTTYRDALTGTGGTKTQTATTRVLGTLITLVPNPDVIVANGTDISLLTSRVTDENRQPLPDGTPITFTTDQGAFENGEQTMVASISGGNGEAMAILTAPVLTVPSVAEVRAIFGGVASDVIHLTVLPGAVSVRVFDAKGEVFVRAEDPNVVVRVIITGTADDGSPVDQVVTIDSMGVYSASDLPPGTYQVQTVLSDRTTGETILESAPQRIRVNPGGAVEPGKNTLSGTIRCRTDPDQIFGYAQVELYDENGTLMATTQTDAAGRYTFDGVEPGKYHIIATASDGRRGQFYLPPITRNMGVVVINADALIDPFGVVFNARTGDGVPVVTVVIVDPQTGEALPIPGLPGTGAFPNVNNVNPFVTDAEGLYAFLFARDQVGLIGQPVRYEMRADPQSTVLLPRLIRIDVSPVSEDKNLVRLVAVALDSLPLCEPGRFDLVEGPVVVPNIETVALNIPLFSTASPLKVSKIAPDSVLAGQDVIYRIVYENVSALPVNDVIVSDEIPEWSTFVESSGGGVFSDSVVSWEMGTVAAGAADTLKLRVRLDFPLPVDTKIVNRAVLGGRNILLEDIPPVYDEITTVVRPSPALDIVKTAAVDSVRAGDEVEYTLVVRNVGGGPATSVAVSDTLPRYTALLSASGGGTLSDGAVLWNLGTLEPGETDSLYLRVGVRFDLPVSGDLENVGTVRCAEGVHARSAPAVVIARGESDLRISKEADLAEVRSGEIVTYTVVVDNRGTADAQDVAVQDRLPASLEYVEGSGTPEGVYLAETRTVIWSLGTVARGAADTLIFQTRAGDNLTPGTHVVENTAQLLVGGASILSSNTVSLSVLVPYLKIEKSANKTVVETGDIVRYQVTVTNASASDSVYEIQVEDRLPHSFDYMPGTTHVDGRRASDPSGGRPMTWTIGDLGPSESRKVHYLTVIGADAESGGGVNEATAGGRAAGPFAGALLRTGPACKGVLIRPNLFAPGEVILGKVWVDANGNRIHDQGERTVPGVALVSEDGTRVTTDEYGNYSIPEVKPGDHVVRLLEKSLPPGLRPMAPQNAFAGDPLSQFVSLPKYAMAKANFMLMETVVPFQKRVARVVPPGILALSKRVFPERVWVPVESQVVRIGAAYFRAGSAEMRPEMRSRLEEVCAQLTDALHIRVEGHTDSSPMPTGAGKFSSNQALSEARALSVAALVSEVCGIQRERMSTVGYGATLPMASNESPEGRAQNRRVEVIPVYEKEEAKVTVHYELTVDYTGEEPARGVTLVDSLPSAARLLEETVLVEGVDASVQVDSLGRMVWDLGAFSSEQEVRVKFDVEVEVAGLDSLVNQAYLWSGSEGRLSGDRIEAVLYIDRGDSLKGATGGRQSSLYQQIVPDRAVVPLDSTGNPAVGVGDRVRFDMAIRLPKGPGGLGVTLTDTLPKGLVYGAESSRLWDREVADPVGDSVLVWTLLDIPADTVLSFTFDVEVAAYPVGGEYVNTAHLQAVRPKNNVVLLESHSNSARVRVRSPGELSLSKRVFPERVWVAVESQVVRIGAAYFRAGSAEMRPEMRSRLEEVCAQLTDALYIRVEGHTDSSPMPTGAGKFSSNQALSEARALSVAALVSEVCGIQRERMSTVGYGATLPMASNESPEGRAQNRRVEVIAERQAPKHTVTYELTVHCSGEERVRAVALVDSLPSAARLLEETVLVEGVDASVQVDSLGRMVWNFGAFSSEQEVRVKFDVEVEVAGLDSLVNQAYLWSGSEGRLSGDRIEAVLYIDRGDSLKGATGGRRSSQYQQIVPDRAVVPLDSTMTGK